MASWILRVLTFSLRNPYKVVLPPLQWRVILSYCHLSTPKTILILVIGVLRIPKMHIRIFTSKVGICPPICLAYIKYTLVSKFWLIFLSPEPQMVWSWNFDQKLILQRKIEKMKKNYDVTLWRHFTDNDVILTSDVIFWRQKLRQSTETIKMN